MINYAARIFFKVEYIVDFVVESFEISPWNFS